MDWFICHLVHAAAGDSLRGIASRKGYDIGPVFHGSPYLFNVFSHTSDIGYHFGTAAAAKARSVKMDVSIEPVEPSPVDLFAMQVEDGTAPSATPKDKLTSLLFRKLDYPSVDKIRAELASMDEAEVEALTAEYTAKPDSARFPERVERARRGIFYRLEAGGETKDFDTEEEAEMYLAQIPKAKNPGAYFLSLSNPVEIPDLGVWPAGEIAEECGFDEAEKRRVYNSDDPYSEVVSILESKGHYGIKYENVVEDPGSISYIVFHPWQIKSADATTYNDKGDPIPVDARFDKTNEDVRY
jgi:hypothetical protein